MRQSQLMLDASLMTATACSVVGQSPATERIMFESCSRPHRKRYYLHCNVPICAHALTV